MGLTNLNTNQGAEREAARLGGSPAPKPLYNLNRVLNEASSLPMSYSIADKLPEEFGKQRRDFNIKATGDLNNLGEYRAADQSGFSKLFNGIAKGTVLAGTTFLDGTLGLAVGVPTAIAEGRLSGLFDNAFSNAMKGINDRMEEVLPNNYSQAELEGNFLNHVFTANFIGDKFLKNLGFTIGAMYSGAIWTKALSFIPKAAAAMSASTKAGQLTSGIMGTSIASLNEARIEALNNSKDWYQLRYNQLEEFHKSRLQDIANSGLDYYSMNEAVNKENFDFKQATDRLSSDAAKVGNMDMITNFVLLNLTNGFQFGKMFANSYGTARRVTNAALRDGKVVNTAIKGRGVVKGILDANAEGFEEISQSALARTSGNFYDREDVTSYYRNSKNPENTDNIAKFISTVGRSINETLNDNSAWEEYFIGALTGATGMIQVGKANTKGSDIGRGKSIGLTGGIAGNIARSINENRRTDEVIAKVNETLQNPKFQALVSAANRHVVTQEQMDIAALQGDKKAYKDAEFSQMISDVIAFDACGLMGTYKDLINSTLKDENLTDEFLSELREQTKKIDESTKKDIGPFSEFEENEEGNNKMRERLKETRETLLKAADKYQQIKEGIDVKSNAIFTDEQLGELTWMAAKIDNWQERSNNLADTIVKELNNLKNNTVNISESLPKALAEHLFKVDEYNESKFKAEVHSKGQKDIQLEQSIDSLLATIEKNKAVLASLLNSPIKDDAKTTFKDTVVKWLDALAADSARYSINSSNVDLDTLKESLNDLAKIGNDIIEYNKALQNFKDNPESLTASHEAADAQVAEQAEEVATKKAVDTYQQAATPQKKAEVVKQMTPEDQARIKETLPQDDTLNALVFADQFSYAVYSEIDNIDGVDDSYKELASVEYNDVVDQIFDTEHLFALTNPWDTLIELRNLKRNETKDNTDYSNQDAIVNWIIAQALNNLSSYDEFRKSFLNYVPAPVATKPTALDKVEYPSADGGELPATPITVETVSPKVDEDVELNNPSQEVLEQLVADNKKQRQSVIDKVPAIGRKYYIPAIPLEEINAKYNFDHRPFWEVQLENEFKKLGYDKDFIKNYINTLNNTPIQSIYDRGTEEYNKTYIASKENIEAGTFRGYYDIYKFLEQEDAFDIPSNTNFKEGSTIAFGVNSQLGNDVIVMYWKDGDTYKVCGTLPVNKKYEGSEDLAKDVKASLSITQGSNRISTLNTTVQAIKNGVVQYTREEYNLKDLDTSQVVGYGIIKRDRNNKLTIVGENLSKYKDIIIPYTRGFDNLKGALVALVKTPNGSYYPILLKTTPVSTDILQDNSQSGFIHDLNATLDNVVNASTRDEAQQWFSDLIKEYLHFNNYVSFYSAVEKDGRIVPGPELKENSNEPIGFVGIANIEEDRLNQQIYKEAQAAGNTDVVVGHAINYYAFGEKEALKVAIIQAADYYSPNRKLLNTTEQDSLTTETIDYNKQLIDAGILTTNAKSLEIKGSFFTTNYYDASTKTFKPAEELKAPVEKRQASNTLSSINGVVDESKLVNIMDYAGGTYYYNKAGNSNGTVIYKDTNGEFYFVRNTARLTINGIKYAAKRFIEDIYVCIGQQFNESRAEYITYEANGEKNYFRVIPNLSSKEVTRIMQLILDDNGKVTQAYRVPPVDSDGKVSKGQQVITNIYNAKLAEIRAQQAARAAITKQQQAAAQVTQAQANNNTDDRAVNFDFSKADVDLTSSQKSILSKYNIDKNLIDIAHVITIKGESKIYHSVAIPIEGSSFYAIPLSKTYENAEHIPCLAFRLVSNQGATTAAFNSGIPVSSNAIDFNLLQSTLKESLEELGNPIEIKNLAKLPNLEQKPVQVNVIPEQVQQVQPVTTIAQPTAVAPIPVNTPVQTPVRQNTPSETLNKVIRTLNEYTAQFSIKDANGNSIVNRTAGQYIRTNADGSTTPYVRLHAFNYEYTDNRERPSNSYAETVPTLAIKKGQLFDTFCREYGNGKSVEEAISKAKELIVSTDQNAGTLNTFADGFSGSAKVLDDFRDQGFNIITNNLYICKQYVCNEGKIGVAGEMDCVLEKDGKLYVVDFKAAGADVAKDPFYNSQLKFYAEALQEMTGIETIPYGWIYLNTRGVNNTAKFLQYSAKECYLPTKTEKESIIAGIDEKDARMYNRIAEKAKYEIAANTGTVIVNTPVEAPASAPLVPVLLDSNTKPVDAINDDLDDIKIDDDLQYKRQYDTDNNIPMNVQLELKWLDRALPQISREDKLEIVNTLIDIKGSHGAKAYGQFRDGIITLASTSNTARGTLFHEAFHYVFHTMLDPLERAKIFDEAKELYNSANYVELEERLADDFLDYVVDEEYVGDSITARIKRFFIKLKRMMKNIFSMRNDIDNLFYNIDRGYFANKPVKDVKNLTRDKLDVSHAIMANNGYSLDLTPTGKKSILFESLLESTGSYEAAIIAKAKCYNPEFINWFGDWITYDKIKNARVIWGHPGTGKTWLFKQGRKDIIDFDSEYKSRLGNLKEREELKKRIGKDAYNSELDKLFDEAKNEALSSGKKLLVSDMHFLRNRSNELDVITNISDKEFIKRSHQRGEHDESNKQEWKDSINKALLNVQQDKIINTTGYISELLDGVGINVSKVVDENGEPLVVFHGTDAKFDEFDNRLAIYASDNIDMTSTYINDNYFDDSLSDTTEHEALKDISVLTDDLMTAMYAEDDALKSREYKHQIEFINDHPEIEKIVREDGFENAAIYIHNKLFKSWKKALRLDNISKHNIPLFMNIKNPLIVDGEGRNWNNIYYEGKSVKTRKIEVLARERGYDGCIIRNIQDLGASATNIQRFTNDIKGNVFIVFNPNQVKSAVDNNGEFNTENNNIYYKRVEGYDHVGRPLTVERYQQLIDNTVNHDSLRGKGFNINNHYGKWVDNYLRNYGIEVHAVPVKKGRSTYYKVDRVIDRRKELIPYTENGKVESFEDFKKAFEIKANFDLINPISRNVLSEEGFTKETWEKLSDRERAQILECI